MSNANRRVALSWADNADRCAVAVAANRLAAHGLDVTFVSKTQGPHLREGDFVLPSADPVSRLLSTLGLQVGGEVSDEVPWAVFNPLRAPRIALLAGQGSAYPYYAYYAHSLACLGLRFTVLDAPQITSGGLDAFDLLLLPGGFSIWGLDRCEATPGTDAAVRRFLASGGACIGSCGGAYYLSQGRPGWLGVAAASPRYTHEYLKSGAGIVSLRLAPSPLTIGCAPALEMPYYHGPIYDNVREPCEVAGWFDSLSLAADIPIANPLDEARFRSDMAGRAAILHTQGPSGRAVLFSAHPEMGDIVRKYVSMRSYAQVYLPIRGPAVLEQTLDFYVPNDAPCFRLIHNAVQTLVASEHGSVADTPGRMGESASGAPANQAARDVSIDLAPQLIDTVQSRLQRFGQEASPIGDLVAREVERLQRLAGSLDVNSQWMPGPSVARVVRDAIGYLSAPPSGALVPQAQRLLDLEFPLRFLEASLLEHRADKALVGVES